MKKIVLAFILILSLFIAPNVFAKTEVTNLEETLKAENIKISGKYEENDKQVTLYLFRGEGCSHCQELLNYLNSLVKDYGSKFKLRAYEVWNNKDNAELQEKAAKKMEVDASGVPFLIIGENTFYGFQDSDKEKIVKSIEREYKKKQSDRYDLFDNIKESKKSNNSALIVLVPLLIIAVIVFLTRTPSEG